MAVLVVPVVVAMAAAVPVPVAVAVVAAVVPPVMPPPPSMGLCLRFRKAGSTCGDCAVSCCFVVSSVGSLVKIVGDGVMVVVVVVVVVPAVLRRRSLEKTRLSA